MGGSFVSKVPFQVWVVLGGFFAEFNFVFLSHLHFLKKE